MSDMHERRMNILRRVSSGELSLEESNRLLAKLEQQPVEEPGQPASTVWPTILPAGHRDGVAPVGADPDPPGAPVLPGAEARLAASVEKSAEADPPPASNPPQATAQTLNGARPVETVPDTRPSSGWRGLWVLPFLLGLFLTLVSVNWMYLGYVSAGLGWGFWLSFFPLALGIMLMWAGWETRKARWLHLRIRQQPGQTPAVVAISLPLPIGLTRWAVQRFGKFSPTVNGKEVGDFLDEFDQAITADGPMHVYIDNDNGGQVELWIEGPSKNI